MIMSCDFSATAGTADGSYLQLVLEDATWVRVRGAVHQLHAINRAHAMLVYECVTLVRPLGLMKRSLSWPWVTRQIRAISHQCARTPAHCGKTLARQAGDSASECLSLATITIRDFSTFHIRWCIFFAQNIYILQVLWNRAVGLGYIAEENDRKSRLTLRSWVPSRKKNT